MLRSARPFTAAEKTLRVAFMTAAWAVVRAPDAETLALCVAELRALACAIEQPEERRHEIDAYLKTKQVCREALRSSDFAGKRVRSKQSRSGGANAGGNLPTRPRSSRRV